MKGRRTPKKTNAAGRSPAVSEAAPFVESGPADGGGGGLATALSASGVSAEGVAALREKSLLTAAALTDLVAALPIVLVFEPLPSQIW